MTKAAPTQVVIGQPTTCQVHDGTNVIDSIWRSGVSSLCVFGKPYIRGLFDPVGRIASYIHFGIRCCCWLPDPFRGMGAWRKTMEPQKPGNFPGSGPEVVERQIEGTCVSKYFEETVRFQSEIRREWIREIRGEKLQEIAEGASSALRLASSSAASIPGRNECPGTHCSLIEQEEREDSSCQISHRVWDKRKDGGEDRTRVRQVEKKNGILYGVAETSKERAEWRRLQRKNWNILGLPKRKEWPQCHRESS